MTAARLTISLDPDVAEELRALVPTGEMSAYIVEAIRQRLRLDPVRALLQELDSLHGPISDTDRTEGDTWFDETLRWSSSIQEQ